MDDGFGQREGLGGGENGVEELFGVGCANWGKLVLIEVYFIFDCAIMAEEEFA